MNTRSSPTPPEPHTPAPDKTQSKSAHFESDTSFQVQHGVVHAEIDGELIVADLLRDRYFRINATGAFLWAHVARNGKFGELAEALEREYGLGAKEARDVLSDYLDDAISNGILASSDAEQAACKADI